MAKSKKLKPMPGAEAALPSPTSNDDWKHEDNARTLTKAGEILSNPEMMKGAHKHLKKQKKAMRSVHDLIEYRNKKHGPKADDEMED